MVVWRAYSKAAGAAWHEDIGTPKDIEVSNFVRGPCEDAFRNAK